MKRIGLLSVLLLVIGFLGLAGCASNSMRPVTDIAAITKPLSQDEAAIVFFRPSALAQAIQAPVLEVVGDQLQFVALIPFGTKFLHKTTPGKHLYLIDGEFGYFMDSDLEGGKTYYACVDPRIGWWRARFVFVPVTSQDFTGDKFTTDFARCNWYENSHESLRWFENEEIRLKNRYADLIQKYSSFKPEEKTKMLPEYGVALPIQ